MDGDIAVSLICTETKAELDLETASVNIISFDDAAAKNSGLARRLLACSVLYCYCGTLKAELKARNARFHKITGSATVQNIKDSSGHNKVAGITLDVTVVMLQEDIPLFEQLTQIMDNGCLITRSIEPAIAMRYNLKFTCDSGQVPDKAKQECKPGSCPYC